MSKLSRKEFKELLTEWDQNFINERVSADMYKNLKDIVSSNTSLLSDYSLNKKMNKLPVLIIDIDNSVTLNSEIFWNFIEAIDNDSALENNLLESEWDDPNTGYGRILYEWENKKDVLQSLFKILNKFNILDESGIRKKDVEESFAIIFKDKAYDDESTEDALDDFNTYNNLIWTLHDVMHRISDDTFPENFDKKSFEGLNNELFRSFYDIISKTLSLNNKKFKSHTLNGDDFTASYIVFLFLYIIEVQEKNINVQKSIENLDKFLKKITSKDDIKNIEEKESFVNTVSDKTKVILEDIDKILQYRYIQLLLFRSLHFSSQ
jgi:hypothetical protein